MGCENKNGEELLTKAILLQTTLPLSVKLVKKRDSLIMKIEGCISNNAKTLPMSTFQPCNFNWPLKEIVDCIGLFHCTLGMVKKYHIPFCSDEN